MCVGGGGGGVASYTYDGISHAYGTSFLESFLRIVICVLGSRRY